MKADERRASIIEATLPLLRDRGRAVSTKEISRAAGIAEGTIFRVFDTKDELIGACIHQAFETGRLRRELRAIDLGLPLAQRLTAAVEIMQAHLKGVFTLMISLQASGHHVQRPKLADEHRRERQRSVEEVDAEFEALIAPDCDDLRIPPAKVVGYLRMLTLASVHPFMEERPTSAAEVVDIVLQGALRRSPTAIPHIVPTSRGKK
jgi:AcrR family transcriptional regulator